MRAERFSVFWIAICFSCGVAVAQEASSQAADAYLFGGEPLSPVSLEHWSPLDSNWADLALKPNFHEHFGYNDNIYALYNGFPLPAGVLKGDWYNSAGVGGSSKFNVGGQQIFFDGNYTVINYLHDHMADAHNYSLDGGVNWLAGSHCQGKLIASDSLHQATLEELFGPGLNTIHATSLSNTGSCNVYEKLSWNFNGGLLENTNSAVLSQGLDYRSWNAGFGPQYALSEVENARFIVQFSERNFTNGLVGPSYSGSPYGALPPVDQVNYQLSYDRFFSDRFDMSLMGGLSSVRGGGLVPATTPVYSLTFNWSPSRKWLVNGGVSQSVGAPSSVLSPSQTTMAERIAVTYQWTPKISTIASLSRSNATGNAPYGLTGYAGSYYGSSVGLSPSLQLNYMVTPFINASASVQRSDRVGQGFHTVQDIVLVGLDYQPY